MTFQDSHLSSVMGTMIYVVALAEDVARGQADPNRLNDHAGTSMQCDDAGARGDWMHSAPPSPPCLLSTLVGPAWARLCALGARCNPLGCVVQTFQPIGLSLPFPLFLSFLLFLSIPPPSGSVPHAPSLVPSTGTPGWIRVMVLKQELVS